MPSIVFEQIESKTFGRCIKIGNGCAELVAALDFGPRILHFSAAGKQNMFYNDAAKTPLEQPLEIYGGERLILYGGHRIWASPEIIPRCYHPDNLPVKCERHESGFVLTGEIERYTGIQKIMNVAMSDDTPEVRIEHTIVNRGVWEIELGVWCITMLDGGGKEIVPMPDAKTGYLPNRNFALWDYSDMSDPRVYWGKDFITLAHDSKIAKPFKLGLNNEAGWGAYFNKGQVFVKFFEPEINGVFPDNGCCYETYVNGFMLEAETLSELDLLAPGESATHTEDWEIYEADKIPSNDEKEIKKAVAKFLNIN